MADEAVGLVTGGEARTLVAADGEQLVSAIGMAASTATSPRRAILEDDDTGSVWRSRTLVRGGEELLELLTGNGAAREGHQSADWRRPDEGEDVHAERFLGVGGGAAGHLPGERLRDDRPGNGVGEDLGEGGLQRQRDPQRVALDVNAARQPQVAAGSADADLVTARFDDEP